MRFWVGDAGESKRKFNGADLSFKPRDFQHKGDSFKLKHLTTLHQQWDISIKQPEPICSGYNHKIFWIMGPLQKTMKLPNSFLVQLFHVVSRNNMKIHKYNSRSMKHVKKKNGALRIIGSPKQLKKITVFLETPWKFQDRFQWFWTNGFGWESRRF